MSMKNKEKNLSIRGKKLYNFLNGPSLVIFEKVVKVLPVERRERLVKILLSDIPDERKPILKKEVQEYIAKKEKREREEQRKREREIKEQLKREEERKRLDKLETLYCKEKDPNNHAIHMRYVNNTDNKKRTVNLSVNKWLSETFYRPTETEAKINLLPDYLKTSIKGYHHLQRLEPVGIYRFYNDEGMSYIGQSKDVWSRALDHLSPSTLESSNGKLQQYVREHGCDNLKFEILVYGDKLKKSSYGKLRKHLEAFLIQEYDSINNGWNKKTEHTLEESGFDIEETRRLCESWGILPKVK